MPTRPPRPGATLRRDFLKLAALVPAVAAGCATARPAPGAAADAAPAPAAPPQDGLAALRAFPLDPAAEPAFVFRARGVRGRGP